VQDIRKKPHTGGFKPSVAPAARSNPAAPASVRTLLGFPARTPSQSPPSRGDYGRRPSPPVQDIRKKPHTGGFKPSVAPVARSGPAAPASIRTLLGFPARTPSQSPPTRGDYGRRPYLQPHVNKNEGLGGLFTRKKDKSAQHGLGRPLTQVAVLSAAVIPLGGILMLVTGPWADPGPPPSTTAAHKEVTSSQAAERPKVTPSWALGKTALPVDAQPSAAAPGPSAAPGPDAAVTEGSIAVAPASRITAPRVNAVSAAPTGTPAPPPPGPAVTSSKDPVATVLSGAEVATVLSGAEKVVSLVSKELESAAAKLKDPTSLILYIWGPEGARALLVAVCESNLRTWARSPTGYEGIFQLGAVERAEYGAQDDARSQIDAAHRLFLARGWEPWPICAQGF
jgi:hypothetical protein